MERCDRALRKASPWRRSRLAMLRRSARGRCPDIYSAGDRVVGPRWVDSSYWPRFSISCYWEYAFLSAGQCQPSLSELR